MRQGGRTLLATLRRCVCAAPLVFHTPYFQSPVAAGPDQLVVIGGQGFQADDRIVYQLMATGARPSQVPPQSARDSGTAEVIRSADAGSSITVRMPHVLAKGEEYRLWVVNSVGQWSEPIAINDPRPLWFSPSVVYATSDVAGLHRQLRIVGRNLQPAGSDQRLHVRLTGPQSYSLDTHTDSDNPQTWEFVAESNLPAKLAPGDYTVSVNKSGNHWVEVPRQKLTVRADVPQPRRFAIDSAAFGGCHAGDGHDAGACISAAIAAARQAGGGVVYVPAGTWDLLEPDRAAEAPFVLTPGIWLEGAANSTPTLLRHDDPGDQAHRPWFILEGNNRITGLKFVDERRFRAFDSGRSVFQLGHRWKNRSRDSNDVIRDVLISGNTFRHVGLAIADSGFPIERLVVTDNQLGGFAHNLNLVGTDNSRWRLFRVADSIIRHNRFVPGSYLDLSVSQGAIAAEIGAATRVDISRNEVDGSSSEELQDPHDQPGFRAAFFWDLHDSVEMLLLDRNRIACSGDKAGDGEAIAFDEAGTAFGYEQTMRVSASGPRSVSVSGPLVAPPAQWTGGPDSYYVGHWIVVVDGPGRGQARKIGRYHTVAAAGTSEFDVWPDWDVAPSAGLSRIIVDRQYWQTYVVGNEIIQSQPTCRKSNLMGPRGGEINMYATSADSVIAGNRQFDTNGVGFKLKHSVRTRSCPKCESAFAAQLALEVRRNLIRGEYDWTSDCSLSGIHAMYAASPTPEAPPMVMSYGVAITDNEVEHADGLRGGGIDIVPTWYAGPEPRRWPLLDNLIIADNVLENFEGPAPTRTACRIGQTGRPAIRIEGGGIVVGTILSGNTCERAPTPIVDGGVKTLRLCAAGRSQQCECSQASR